jgi:replicative DNA helicase
MVSITDLRLPPHHIDAEKWLLSSVFLDNDVMFVMDSLGVVPQDFYQKEYQYIASAMVELWQRRQTIDVVTVSNILQKWDILDNIGGVDLLFEITAFAMTATAAPEYAKIVKEKSILRNILKTCQVISGDVYEQEPVPMILEKIEKRIFDLTQVQMSDSLRHIKDILNSRLEDYMDIVDNPHKLDEQKINSHFAALDEVLWWFRPGDLCILAARPSMGKTAFAINIMINAAIKSRKSVCLFSLEMPAEQITDRIISMVSDIPMHKIVKGALEEEDFAVMGEAMEQLSSTHLYIDDVWGITVQEMRSKLRRTIIEKWPLDLVVVDYLQLMSDPKFNGNKVQEVGEISKWLKNLAKELKVPVIALSQLSRNVEQRADRKPQLSDLRESGAIEQDADSVMMLYREDYYDPYTDKKWLANVFIRKNRNWPVWEIELERRPEVMKFYTLSWR